MKTWLVDTGPFIAYIDRTDPAHASVAECLDGFTGQIATTAAVVTEVMYFLADVTAGPASFAELLVASGARIAESIRPDGIFAAAELMSKYADTPMDFADATLVQLADDLRITEILTLDRRGFSTYRTATGKPFRLVLDLAMKKATPSRSGRRVDRGA
jgi:predicted nucleic acid-binding protein